LDAQNYLVLPRDKYLIKDVCVTAFIPTQLKGSAKASWTDSKSARRKDIPSPSRMVSRPFERASKAQRSYAT